MNKLWKDARAGSVHVRHADSDVFCSHQRPERHAHRGLQDDGVPMLHVRPVPARLRQLRVVVHELEQDDDQAVT